MVMFHIPTAKVILSFLWRFQMNYAIRKKRGTDGPQTDRTRTDGRTDPHKEMRGRQKYLIFIPISSLHMKKL